MASVSCWGCHFFVVIAVVSLYQAWRLYLVAARRVELANG